MIKDNMRWLKSSPPNPLRPGGLGLILLALTMSGAGAAAAAGRTSYPLSPASDCGGGQTCAQVLERWNDASWADLVDEGFNTGSLNLATVRWYTTEFPCTGLKCNDQLNSGGGSCPVLSVANSQFCGVTDELGNVLLSLAMGSNQGRYEKLHHFTELLRHPAANNLQCWKFYVNGRKAYDDYTKLCVVSDSASDASIRILGAYGIACAKQRSGLWPLGSTDYCADYLKQGNAIWGIGTASHGEIKQLGNGQYFLANGFMNEVGAPAGAESFRPDYYELQFLMDFAKYRNDPAMVQGILDMLTDYSISTGDNHIHRGKKGHFDSTTTVYSCDDTCAPPYMDRTDTWRAIPALSGLLSVHQELVPAALKSSLFDVWWQQYAGGNPTLYGPTAAKPIEIYANSADGTIKAVEESYKTLGMWIPLGASYDAAYTTAAIHYLVEHDYDGANEQFFGAAYYGGYFSQFAQRAIGAATGMIDPAFWAPSGTGLDFYSVPPCRVFDTRGSAPLVSGTVQTFSVAGICGIPASAHAIAVNLTETGSTGGGNMVVYAGNTTTPPTSNINFGSGQTRANNAVVQLSTDGMGTVRGLALVAGGGRVDLILDVVGYFK
jgi:hypothetical protein